MTDYVCPYAEECSNREHGCYFLHGPDCPYLPQKYWSRERISEELNIDPDEFADDFGIDASIPPIIDEGPIEDLLEAMEDGDMPWGTFI